MSRLNEEFKTLYPINEVKKGYGYWIHQLLEKCIMIFDWKGLPKTLPEHELEKLLITYGYGGVVNTDKGIICTYGSMHGVTMYDDIFHYFTFANPYVTGGTFPIYSFLNENGKSVIAKNNSLMNPLKELICRYARQLSDIDASINICTVNTRAMTTDVASTQPVAESVKLVRKKQQLGYYDCVIDQGIFENLKSLSNVTSGGNKSIEDLLLCRESTLRAFYREIGVQMSNNKRERMITDEVNSESQLLLINIKDMLAKRKECAEQLNECFGLNASVEISEEFKPGEVGSIQPCESEEESR